MLLCCSAGGAKLHLLIIGQFEKATFLVRFEALPMQIKIIQQFMEYWKVV